MLHLITTERQVQLRGGAPASICAYAQRPPRQRLSSNGVFGKVAAAGSVWWQVSGSPLLNKYARCSRWNGCSCLGIVRETRLLGGSRQRYFVRNFPDDYAGSIDIPSAVCPCNSRQAVPEVVRHDELGSNYPGAFGINIAPFAAAARGC